MTPHVILELDSEEGRELSEGLRPGVDLRLEAVAPLCLAERARQQACGGDHLVDVAGDERLVGRVTSSGEETIMSARAARGVPAVRVTAGGPAAFKVVPHADGCHHP